MKHIVNIALVALFAFSILLAPGAFAQEDTAPASDAEVKKTDEKKSDKEAAKTTKAGDGSESLPGALDRDHDGGILENLDDF